MIQESPGQVAQPREREGALPQDRRSDSWLLERLVLHQDQAAFEALVRRHGPGVRGVCRRWLRDGHAAEDACQETFLVLLHKARSIGKPELLAGWLHGVAWRVALRARTKAARRSAHERRTAADKVADPVADIARRDLGTIVAAAVNDLPATYREAVILHYWEGKTCEKIARQLGCPLGSMSWRLGRGRELLRRRLSGLANETAR
jgi:RNA polymerase sigma factor (sigma-70 family)